MPTKHSNTQTAPYSDDNEKINSLIAEYKPTGKRKKFRAGELVNFLDGPSKTMTVVKYSLDSAERSFDHSLVVVTWMESKQRKIAKYPEDTLKAVTKKAFIRYNST